MSSPQPTAEYKLKLNSVGEFLFPEYKLLFIGGDNNRAHSKVWWFTDGVDFSRCGPIIQFLIVNIVKVINTYAPNYAPNLTYVCGIS